MVTVRLEKWKIKRLELFNTLRSQGRIRLSESSGFEIKVSDDHSMAVASLKASIGEKEHFNALGIQIELEGFFSLEGVEKSPKSKKEADMRCYDAMFPYADQIVKFLAMNSAMNGITLRKEEWARTVFDLARKEGERRS